nr:putative ribonuclease H-like domain-containing protein [Tanacetum cinerariifolium]
MRPSKGLLLMLLVVVVADLTLLLPLKSRVVLLVMFFLFKVSQKALMPLVEIKVKNASTPIETQKPLLKDEDGKEVDVHMYRSMIGLLMCLISSRPDIIFAVCACARYQVNPKVSHLYAMKRIFSARNKLGLQIPPQNLNMWLLQVVVDKRNARLIMKERCVKTERVICLKLMLLGITYYCWVDVNAVEVYTSCIEQFWATVKAKTVNREGQLQALVDGKKVIITESTIRRDLQLEDAKDEAINEEMDDSLERAATTATSVDAEQDRGVNTSQSGEDSLTLNELMELCIKLQQRVLDFETIKTTQALDIDNLKRRVKKLEMIKRSRNYRLKRLYKVGLSVRVESSEDEILGEEDASKQGRIADIDANKDIYLINVHNDKDMFGVNDLDGDEVIVESVDVAEQAKEVVNDITLAKALMEIKSTKPKDLKVVIQEQEQGTTITTPTTITAASTRPKAKGLVIHEQEQAPTPTVSSQQPSQVKDKGKGKMVEPEPMKKLSKKDQLMLDEELTFKLQAKN